jgi:hypothetical protein
MLGNLRSRPAVAVVAFIVGATVAVGVAWAAVPSTTAGTITACYPTSGSAKGSLRVIDYQAGAHCAAGQAMIKWQADGMRWRGAWTGTKTYYTGDVVGRSGASYIAVQTSTNVVPPSSANWALMAAKGTNGVAGATGPAGDAQCSGYPHTNVNWSLPGSTPGNGCNFDSANLANQTLTGADMTNANLHAANLANADLSHSSLIGANLANGSLSGANMVDANLSNATVTDADLTFANLSNVHLNGASLEGSDLTNANVTGIVFSGTTCPDGTVSNTNGTNPEGCTGHGGGF